MVAHCLIGVASFSPLPTYGLRMLLGGGSSFLLHHLDARLGRAMPWLGVPLQPLAARSRRALLGEGYPPSFSTLVDVRVKPALLVGGSLFPVIVL